MSCAPDAARFAKNPGLACVLRGFLHIQGMIPYLACMMTVASVAHLPPRVLPVIQHIEGGAPGMVRPDRNGSADLGVMQVNTIWVNAIAARAHLPPRVAEAKLIGDPCFNIAAAGLILRLYLNQNGGALLPSIGDYHSHTLVLNRAYTLRAEAEARTLFGP
jgi:hypothetical protein